MANSTLLAALGSLLALAGAAQAQTAIFAPATTYSTGANSKPVKLTTADVNADGKLDVLVASRNLHYVSVLLGNGNGTFQTAIPYSTGANSFPVEVAVADVNNDGKPDLLTANASAIGVLLGNGNGTFQAISLYTSNSPGRLAVADVTGDGKLDVLSSQPFPGISVLPGNGNGTFQTAITFSAGINSPNSMTVADVNGDGKLDILTCNPGTYASPTPTMGLVLSNGNGTFQPPAAYGIGTNGGYPWDIAVGDLNQDGKPDVAIMGGNMMASVLLGNGNGTFQAAITYSAATISSSSSEGIAIADVTGDSKPDLLVTYYEGSIMSVLQGNGNGTFQAATTFLTGPDSAPIGIVAADVNNDGRLDVLTANSKSSTIGVLLNITTVLATRATLTGTSATLHPNPASTSAALALAGLPAAIAQVQATLLDATGRVMDRQQLAAAQGTARAEVPTAGLAAGLYVLRLTAYDAQGQPAGSLPTQRLSVQ